MENSIDLYSEEFADDYVDLTDENRESREEAENQEAIEIEDDNQAGGDAEEGGDDNDEEEKKIVKPKRVIKNPRPKLNVESLKGHKGLLCLENYFKDKKYKGYGHEEEDLRTIMKTYEYWCHRLFPKLTFDECIEKIEKLGTKKEAQTYLKRIRMDLIFDEDQPIRDDEDDDDNDQNQETRESNNAFDELRSEQHNNQIPTLTDEQLERIRINREKANHLRLERLQKAKEKAQSALPQEMTDELDENNVTIKDVDVQSQEDVHVFEENSQEKSRDVPVAVATISDMESNTVTSQVMEEDDGTEIPVT